MSFHIFFNHFFLAAVFSSSFFLYIFLDSHTAGGGCSELASSDSTGVIVCECALFFSLFVHMLFMFFSNDAFCLHFIYLLYPSQVNLAFQFYDLLSTNFVARLRKVEMLVHHTLAVVMSYLLLRDW